MRKPPPPLPRSACLHQAHITPGFTSPNSYGLGLGSSDLLVSKRATLMQPYVADAVYRRAAGNFFSGSHAWPGQPAALAVEAAAGRRGLARPGELGPPSASATYSMIGTHRYYDLSFVGSQDGGDLGP